MIDPRFLPPALIFAGLFLAHASDAEAQVNVAEALAGLDAPNAALYVAPLTHSLARGLFTAAADRDPPGGVFRFRLGVRGTAVSPEDGGRRYPVVLPTSAVFDGRSFADPWATVEGSMETPTAVGDGGGRIVLRPRPGSPFEAALADSGVDPDAVRVEFPRGLDLDPVPLLLVEGDLGLGMSTGLAFRLTPTAQVVRELGDVSVLGASVSHGLGRYLLGAEAPLDVVLGVSVQRMRVGGWLETMTTTGALSAGAARGPVHLRATAALGRARGNVRYRAANPDGLPGFPAHGETVRFSADVSTRAHLSMGATLSLGLLDVAGDYAFGDGGSASVAVFLRLR